MTPLLIFAVVLLVAVLLSELAHRTVLSTALLFLAAGFVCGDSVLDWVRIDVHDPLVVQLTSMTLFAVLYTDGTKVGLDELRSAWRLPGRALLLGLPLVLVLTGLLAHWLLGLGWIAAFLLGAALSPTDPVFASAIVGREEVPQRLRFLLNVESGLNDGLALPIVLALLAMLGSESATIGSLALEVLVGIALGVAVAWVAIKLERTPLFTAAEAYAPLHAVAIALLVFALCRVLHGNEFLGAFAAGVTIATCNDDLQQAFESFGHVVTELLKLAALLVFGLLVSTEHLFRHMLSFSGWAFVLLTLLAVRPAALALALLGVRLGWREWVVAAWFGPKGFASVVFGLLIVRASAPQANAIFHIMAFVIIASMIAHSSTDVLIARWFERRAAAAPATDDGGAGSERDALRRRLPERH